MLLCTRLAAGDRAGAQRGAQQRRRAHLHSLPADQPPGGGPVMSSCLVLHHRYVALTDACIGMRHMQGAEHEMN